MPKKIFSISSVMLMAILVCAFVPVKYSTPAHLFINKNKEGIKFIEGDWSKGLQEAKNQKKLIFLDAYTSWCGPCRLLKKTTFTDGVAGEYFNTNFINVAIDMEKGIGPELLKKYNVNAFPTLIITNADGEILTYTLGYMGPEDLIRFGKYGLSLIKN